MTLEKIYFFVTDEVFCYSEFFLRSFLNIFIFMREIYKKSGWFNRFTVAMLYLFYIKYIAI